MIVDLRPVPDEDAGLVSLCKGGATGPFETLVKRHQKKMLNIVYRMIGDYEEACDVVQEAFVSAYKGINGFEGKSRFSTWLYSIAINQARNRLKQMKARRQFEAGSIDEPVPGRDRLIRLEPASGDPPASDTVERKEIQSKVQECINTLEHGYREILVLRDMQGFSYDEIGSMLGLLEGTVRSRLFRAREAFMKKMKSHLGDL